MKKRKPTVCNGLLKGILTGICVFGVALSGCGSSNSVTTDATGTAAEQDSTAADGLTEETETAVDAAQVEEVLSSDAEISDKLKELCALNADAYAWLEIPGTGISQPILQSSIDDEYYLTHNAAKEEAEDGAIYTETANSTDFTDGNTIIYGHNTADRFGKLHEYQDRTFFDENREIRIYLPEKTLVYRIFAAYPYDDRHLIAAYDFSDPIIFRNYLEEIFSIRQIDAFIDETMDVTEEDHLITLETGVTGEADQRYLVQAVLVEEQ